VTHDSSAQESLQVAASVRARLATGAAGLSDDPARIEALVSELVPFLEAAARAAAAPETPALWQEARSLVYLFAYRLADQEYTPLALASALVAWRDAVGTDVAQARCDEVQALLLDGYARGREDAQQRTLQQSLGAHLPVGTLVPGVVLAVAAGPLDPEGARSLADRAGRELLRREGRAAVLDLSGLERPEPAVLAELWSLGSAARMLGARFVTVGHAAKVRAGVAEGELAEAPHAIVDDLGEGVAAALDAAGLGVGMAHGWRRWILRALDARAPWTGP